jgi:hypothetical protein
MTHPAKITMPAKIATVNVSMGAPLRCWIGFLLSLVVLTFRRRNAFLCGTGASNEPKTRRRETLIFN